MSHTVCVVIKEKIFLSIGLLRRIWSSFPWKLHKLFLVDDFVVRNITLKIFILHAFQSFCEIKLISLVQRELFLCHSNYDRELLSNSSRVREAQSDSS